MKSKISLSKLTLYSSCVTTVCWGLFSIAKSLGFPFSVLGTIVVGVITYEVHKRVLRKYVE